MNVQLRGFPLSTISFASFRAIGCPKRRSFCFDFTVPSSIVARLRLGLVSDDVIGHDQFDRADTKGTGKMKERDNRRIAMAPFQTADILLSHPGDLGETLLSEAFLPPQPREVPANQLAHVHARKQADTHFEVYPL